MHKTVLDDLSVLTIRRTMQISSRPTEIITLHASYGAVYCYWSCLSVCVCVCVCVCVWGSDTTKLRASILNELGL